MVQGSGNTVPMPGVSPGKAVHLPMKNYEQLRYLQQLYEDGILDQKEYAEQKQDIPYIWKIWRELNLVDRPESARANVLAGLNLAVRYGIVICIYACKKYWWILIWRLQARTTKFNSQPNFPTLQYSSLSGNRNV